MAGFGQRAPLVMALLGVIAFLIYAVLSVMGSDLRDGRDGGGHALSEGATGASALVTLLRASGHDVTISRRPDAARLGGLLVLTPPAGSDPAAVAALLAARPPGSATLVVLPKWLTSPQKERRGWVWRGPLVDARAAAAPLSRWLPGAGLSLREERGAAGRLAMVDAARRVSLIAPAPLRTLSGPGLRPVLADASGAAVLAEVQRGLYVLADPDIIANHGLRQLADARGAVALVGSLAGGDAPITFDVTLNGFGPGGRSLGRLALEPPFLGVTLCLLMAAFLAAWSAYPRFGRTQDEAPALARGTGPLIDNAADLVRAAGQQGAAAVRYARQVLERAALRARLPAGLSPEEQARILGDGHDRLAAAAMAARGPAAALMAAQTLHDWEERQSHVRR